MTKTHLTMDHTHTMNQQIEEPQKYIIPLCLAFVDYKKASDSEMEPFLSSSRDRETGGYVTRLHICFNADNILFIKLLKNLQKINIEKGIMLGDAI